MTTSRDAGKRVRGVILDVDGTLINSNDAHARAWVDALAESNIDASFAQIRRLIGMGGDKLLPAVAGIEEASELGQRIAKRRSEIFQHQYFPSVHAFPKTRALLLKMRDHGLKLGVASSAKEQELLPFLELANVRDLLEAATSSSDARGSKPDPDIVQAALDQLQLEPTRVLMLGDTPYDIEAAGRAGLRTIALRCGGRSDAELSAAIAIYDDPADLLAHFASSPLAGDA
jgi:HAD superfamily hydrolase (TIGR01509 family)